MNEVFALTEHELGETSLVEHQIDLNKDSYIAIPYYTSTTSLCFEV